MTDSVLYEMFKSQSYRKSVREGGGGASGCSRVLAGLLNDLTPVLIRLQPTHVFNTGQTQSATACSPQLFSVPLSLPHSSSLLCYFVSPSIITSPKIYQPFFPCYVATKAFRSASFSNTQSYTMTCLSLYMENIWAGWKVHSSFPEYSLLTC